SKRRIDRKGQSSGSPFVGGPAVGAFKFARPERLGIGLHVLLGGTRLLGQKGVGGAVHCANVKRQALQGVRGGEIALFESNEHLLIARLADLQSDAATGSVISAGKAHEGAHRRVLSVETEVIGERSAFGHSESS